MPTVAGHTHQCEAACLLQGNWLVVGAMVLTDLVRGYEHRTDSPVANPPGKFESLVSMGVLLVHGALAVARAHWPGRIGG